LQLTRTARKKKMKEEKFNIAENKNTEDNLSVGVQLRVIKKPAGVLPNIILENRGIRKHRGWNNLLHRVCTYRDNRLKDFAASYRVLFGLLLHLWTQQNRRRLLNHRLLSNVSRQNKLCISFYKFLYELENYVNHIQSLKAAFRFERTPKADSLFGFYVKQIFHNVSIVYYKYNKYYIQCQIVILGTR